MKNKEERVKCVKAMEYLVRQINDEEVFYGWLGIGVADGDIPYGDLSGEVNEDMEYYIDDENFSDLMWLFLELMHDARNNGGLYCDNVVSAEKDYE